MTPPQDMEREPENAPVETSRQKPPTTARLPGWTVILSIVLGAFLLLGGAVLSWVLLITRDLPDEAAIRAYRPYLSTEIHDTKGRLILSLGRDRNRIWRPLNSISPRLVEAVVTSEDDTFFEHQGIRPEEIRKAFWQNLRARRYARGGSTITQQLAKNAFLSREKTIARKVKEIFLARRIESTLDKERILELYLNEVEWGDGLYGAEAASRRYFGKPAANLDLAESALLAGMLPNPRHFDPCVRPDKVKSRQSHVLDLMLHNKVIDDEEHRRAIDAPLSLCPGGQSSRFARLKQRTGDCFEDTLSEYLEKSVGSNAVRRGGKVIKLTLDLSVQHHLDETFAPGTGEQILVAREGAAIRAFRCVGGTGASQTLAAEDAAESASPYALEFMSREDFFNSEIIVEE